MNNISLVLPAKNEALNLSQVLVKLTELYPSSEIILVDDGSSDNTAEIAKDAGVSVVSHPYNMGNGASIKTGTRHAKGNIIVFLDADGHIIQTIFHTFAKIENGYDMLFLRTK